VQNRFIIKVVFFKITVSVESLMHIFIIYIQNPKIFCNKNFSWYLPFNSLQGVETDRQEVQTTFSQVLLTRNYNLKPNPKPIY